MKSTPPAVRKERYQAAVQMVAGSGRAKDDSARKPLSAVPPKRNPGEGFELFQERVDKWRKEQARKAREPAPEQTASAHLPYRATIDDTQLQKGTPPAIRKERYMAAVERVARLPSDGSAKQSSAAPAAELPPKRGAVEGFEHYRERVDKWRAEQQRLKKQVATQHTPPSERKVRYNQALASLKPTEVSQSKPPSNAQPPQRLPGQSYEAYRQTVDAWRGA
jgi:hypothetical protein